MLGPGKAQAGKRAGLAGTKQGQAGADPVQSTDMAAVAAAVERWGALEVVLEDLVVCLSVETFH